jgi:hypothetical protein
LKWFKSFLTGRSQCVQYGGASPPGSVLGPLLFILFVADLPDQVKTSLVQYADDCSLEHLITKDEYADELQSDVDNILTFGA